MTSPSDACNYLLKFSQVIIAPLVMGSGVVLSNAITAIICRRVSDVIIIVASAFKNLSNHEYLMNTLAGVLVHKKLSICYYWGRAGQKLSIRTGFCQ